MIQPLWKMIWKFPIKLNAILPYDPGIHLWVFPKINENICPQNHLYEGVQSRVICNRKKMEAIKYPSTKSDIFM